MAGSLTGVLGGLSHGAYQLPAADAHSVAGPYGFTGTNSSLASGQLAYALAAHGRAATLDAACSSGMLEVHRARRRLHRSES
jgi:polyketide synthase 5